MKSIVFFSLSLLLVVWSAGVFAAETEDEPCEPGTFKQIECNRCTCAANGKFACTRRFCPPPKTKRQAEECQLGEVKKLDCNDCVCNGGQWACTEKGCPEHQEVLCQPGETKKQDCNDCFCANGIWACTLKGCLHLPEDSHKVKRQTSCKPGEIIESEDCNSCFCSNGQVACTLMACPPKKPSSTSVPININKRQAECADGEVKTVDCNSCTCTKGNWSCTKRFCAPPRQKRDYCVPGTTFQRECNTCRCGSNGRAICTLRACITDPRILQSIRFN